VSFWLVLLVYNLFFGYSQFLSINNLHTLHTISHNSAPTLKLELQVTPMAHHQQQQWLQREDEVMIGSSFYNCFQLLTNFLSTSSMPSATTQHPHWIWCCKSPPHHANNCRHLWLWREDEFLTGSSFLIFFSCSQCFSIKNFNTIHVISQKSAPTIN
jgi:hypothetical protein